jgi:hypothetical protein
VTSDRRKRTVLVMVVAAAALLLIASTAWACTTIMGTVTVNPSSGTPPVGVQVSATGMLANTSYNIKYLNPARRASNVNCHYNGTRISNGATTDASGNYGPVSTTIPKEKSSGTGLAMVCIQDPGVFSGGEADFTVL